MFTRQSEITASHARGESIPGREPAIVHSSFGRLRVHLPHWSGERRDELIAAVRGLVGVTDAEASRVTGNVLILFEPHRVSADALLAALPNLQFAAPASIPERAMTVAAPISIPIVVEDVGAKDVYLTGWRRVAYLGLGWASVGMAIVGAILPGIPTAPFVVLAGYFFIHSSPEAHQWLRQSRLFGSILRDWEDHRAIRRSIRNFALALIGVSMVLTSLLGLATPLLVTIIALQTLGLAVVLSLRVVESVEHEPRLIPVMGNG
jgi:uncharacterized membrane protein YbaN (DUF454 family)